LSILEHLDEFRSRLVRIIIFYAFAVLVSYIYSEKIFQIIKGPIGTLIYIHPAELFIAKIKIALFTGIFISFPYLLWHVYLYIKPAFEKLSAGFALFLFFLSALLFYSGIFAAFYLFLPVCLNFLAKFSDSGVSAAITVSNYLSFVFIFVVCFGVIFLSPAVLLLIIKSGFVSVSDLKKSRKYFYLGGFLTAALITPPDVFTQIALAVPLIILFELSILISSLSMYNKKKVIL